MRESFIFYRSFFEAISELEDAQKGRVFDAISNYALNETEPDLSGVEKCVFILVKPQIDANNRKYENGKKGGRPPAKNNQSKTKAKPKRNQSVTKPKPNVNVNENVNEKDIKEKSIKKEKMKLDDLEIEKISEWLHKKRTEGLYREIDENRLLEMFKNYCLSKNPKYKDFTAAFRNSFEWKNAPRRETNGKEGKNIDVNTRKPMHEQLDDSVERVLRQLEQRDQETRDNRIHDAPAIRHSGHIRENS